MASRSEDPETNYDQVNAWDESALRYPVTEVDQSGASDVAEFALVGVGVRFDNRGEPYPPEIDISEEDYTGQPCVRVQAGSSVSVSSRLGDTASPGSSPSTPGPNQAHLESGRPFIQPGDFEHIVRQRIRRSQRLRRRSSKHRTRPSGTASTSCHTTIATTIDDPENEIADRSTTPIPYVPPSHTPSERSEETTEDGHDEGREPVSPHPFSEYHTYDPTHGEDAVAAWNNLVHSPE